MADEVVYGFQEAFGWSRESAFGTQNTTSGVWWRPVSNTLKRADPPMPMRGTTGGRARFKYDTTLPRWHRGLPANRGTVMLEAEYDDIGHILSNAIASPSYAVDTPEPGTYTHSFSVPLAQPAAIPVSGTAYRITQQGTYSYIGAMVDTLSISVREGEIVSVSCDFVFQSGGIVDSNPPAIGSLSATPWVEMHHAAGRYSAAPGEVSASLTTMTEGTSMTDIVDAVITVQNGYRYAQAIGNGIRGPRQFVWESFPQVFATFSRDYYDSVIHDHMFANLVSGQTEADAAVAYALKFSSGTDYITGTTPYSLDCYAPAWIVMDQDAPHAGGAGIIGESVSLEAIQDDSGSDLAVFALVNGTSGATAYTAAPS